MKDYLAQCCCHMLLALCNVAAEVAEGIKEGALPVQLKIRLEGLRECCLPV